MEPRENRIELHMDADVSDGRLCFRGAVSNVSRKGLMMKAIPKKFDFYSKKWVTVINDNGKNFKLLVKPRWSKAQEEGKTIGFQIFSPPLAWVRFFNGLDESEFATSGVFQ